MEEFSFIFARIARFFRECSDVADNLQFFQGISFPNTTQLAANKDEWFFVGCFTDSGSQRDENNK